MVKFIGNTPVTDDEQAVPVAIVSGGSGGGGGGGDASAANQVITNDRIGSTNGSAPANDTATATLNERLIRIAQNITSFWGAMNGVLGSASSTIPANESAIAGINGLVRLLIQRVNLLASNVFSTTVPARTPTTTNVLSSATSVSLIGANTNRRGIAFYNNSTSGLWISFSSPATAANSLLLIPPNGFILLDQQLIITGAITGIWTTANGSVNITEFV